MKNILKTITQKKLHKNYLFILLLVSVSFFIYRNSLWGDFLIDDITRIQNNTDIHNLSTYFSKHFKWDFESINEAILALIWHFSGGSPFGYHLYNITLHTICVILVYVLCETLFANRLLSFFSSLIFAIHPIHTEAVSWISGRPYLMSSLFYLGIFIFYLKGKQAKNYYLLSAFLFIAGLFFAREVFIAPLMIIAYELSFGSRKIICKKDRPLIIILTTLILAISAIVFLSLYISRLQFSRTIFGFRSWSYLVVVIKAFAYYMKILYLPLERGLYHPFSFTTLDIQKISPLFFVSLSILLALILSFFALRRKFYPVAFGIMWFIVAYLPYSNLIPICNIVSERYVYLSSVGVCIILSALFLKAWDKINSIIKYRQALRYFAIGAMTLFMASYSVLTLRRNYDYHNIITYWWSNINNFPDGYIVYNNLAGTFYAMGDLENALSFSYTNLMANSQQPHVWCNLGRIYRDKKDYEQSEYCYKQALEIDENYFPAIKALEEIKKSHANKL
jgi:hypothetical protein